MKIHRLLILLAFALCLLGFTVTVCAKDKVKYELTVVTWYGEHVDKKIQIFETFKKQSKCEARARKIEASWEDADKSFVGIATCLRIN